MTDKEQILALEEKVFQYESDIKRVFTILKGAQETLNIDFAEFQNVTGMMDMMGMVMPMINDLALKQQMGTLDMTALYRVMEIPEILARHKHLIEGL